MILPIQQEIFISPRRHGERGIFIMDTSENFSRLISVLSALGVCVVFSKEKQFYG